MIDKKYEAKMLGDISMSRREYNAVLEFAKKVHPRNFYIGVTAEGRNVLCNGTSFTRLSGYWTNVSHPKKRHFEVCQESISMLSSVALLQDTFNKTNQADFYDELADLLAKHSASITSTSNINIQIKGRTMPWRGIAGRWIGNTLVTGKSLSAKPIRKFRLRSKVV